MKKYTYTVLLASLILLAFRSSASAAVTGLGGSAELSYVQYEAKADGKKFYSGDSFAQKYALAWGASNLYRYSQPQYYKLMLGYDWISFNTNIDEGNVSRELSETYGKFRYNGEIGYQPVHLPIRFTAYLNDDMVPRLRSGLFQGIIGDGFNYEIQDRNKVMSSGFMFVFEPERAYSVGLRGLPRLHVDYREFSNKSDSSLYRFDNKTRELAVAGLNKENNWLHYRSIQYENYLDANDNYEQQQIQIGLIDYVGRRKWSALTNWINVSADGQLTVRKNESHIDNFEEYDINFQAIATRKLWDARTFMNYNREFKNRTLTEEARIPLYVKGIWGSDTNWNFSVNENKGRQQINNGPVATSYLNSVALGLTTFARSSFTLSPYLSVKTEKSYSSSDAYQFSAGAKTSSTRRFSDVYSLTAGYDFSARDDGTGTENSSTWSQKLFARGRYSARHDLTVEASEQLETGSGNAYIDNSRLNGGSQADNNIRDYMRSITTISAAWAPSAVMRTSINANYDFLKVQGAPNNTDFMVYHNFTYDKQDIRFQLDTRYQRRDTGTSAFIDSFTNSGSVSYMPDRYNDASLRYSYYDRSDETGNATELELLQRYNHYFYTKAGVLRNIATISEEYSRTYSSQSGSAMIPGRSSIDSQYLLLSGRYSPTSRLSLYGSVKYLEERRAITMVYNAGLSADFKLLTTTVDYTMGTRDTDKRVEKKLAANVKRSF